MSEKLLTEKIDKQKKRILMIHAEILKKTFAIKKLKKEVVHENIKIEAEKKKLKKNIKKLNLEYPEPNRRYTLPKPKRSRFLYVIGDQVYQCSIYKAKKAALANGAEKIYPVTLSREGKYSGTHYQLVKEAGRFIRWTKQPGNLILEQVAEYKEKNGVIKL